MLNFLPVGMGLYARVAPAAISATVISGYYLNVFVAELLVGWAGGYLERLGGAAFWCWHAAVPAAAGVLMVAIRGAVGRALAPDAA